MKILFECHVYNRKKITEICLNQINQFRDKTISDLHIVNDHSTEFDNEWLSQFGIVKQWPDKETINVLMYRSFKEFLNTDYTHMYHFDNDAFHDSLYFDTLIKLHLQSNGLPVTLYKSSYVASFPNACSTVGSLPSGLIRSGVYGGISVFLSREHIQKIVDNLTFSENVWKSRPNPGWDVQIQNWINEDKKHAVPIMSFVEHYGWKGKNHSDWFNDVAVNPTPFLKETYNDIRTAIEKSYEKIEI